MTQTQLRYHYQFINQADGTRSAPMSGNVEELVRMLETAIERNQTEYKALLDKYEEEEAGLPPHLKECPKHYIIILSQFIDETEEMFYSDVPLMSMENMLKHLTEGQEHGRAQE